MRIPLRQYWSLIHTYLSPQTGRLALLALLLISNLALQLVNPQIVRYFIDTARAGGSERTLVTAAIAFLLVVVVSQGISVADTWLAETVAWTSTNALRRDLAAHCIALDMGFHNTHTPGELIERIDGDVTAMANFMSRFLIAVIGNVLLMVGILVALWIVDWRIGIVLTAFAVVVVAVLNRLRGIAVRPWMAARQASAEMAGFLEEHLAGTEDIRSSRATAYVMGRFFRLMRQIFLRYRSAYIISTVSQYATRVTFTIGLALGLGMGSYLYLRGDITLGTVYLVATYAGILSIPLYELTNQVDDLQQASAGLARVNTLRDLPISIGDGPLNRPGGSLVDVSFDHVTFGYRADDPVLRDISFSVAPREVLGVLGRTGSGKTTISRLLFRLYEPQSGVIRLGGTDIRRLQLSALRGRVGLVTQEVQLYHATVRDNLTFFNRSISDRRILDAVEALGLHAWYAGLTDGLDTFLRGSSGLSAGEAQVLAMTRVFLKNPEVVVLDEASSRLDPATERLIEHAVDALLRDRAAIVIAHRLSTVARADSILILGDGRIVEYGSRATLAADPTSRFAHLLQTGLELEPV